MNKLIYRLINMGTSVLAGAVANTIFRRVWRLAAGQDEAPKATDEERGWSEVLLAAGLQGIVFALVKAVLDRGTAEGTRKLTGSWPGNEDERSGRQKEHAA